jgi:hypothetical protein
MNARHIIGDTFRHGGEIRLGGLPADLTGWTAASRIRGGGTATELACALHVEGGRTWLALSAAPGQQENWRPCAALLDIRLESPAGHVIHSRPIRIALARPITAEAQP